jgi:ubiquinone/menaquinone biosynthesis C-methylase UbiE
MILFSRRPPTRPEMSLESTKRFTERADFYAKYRPSYPRRAMSILRHEFGFRSSAVVADIGSGTGLLSRLFLENGNDVYAVEPNERMRSYAERDLAGFSKFHSVDGTAERTRLPKGSVDVIAVGQALHWFRPPPTIREFSRISKPHGELCVFYNERREEGAFMNAYESLIRRHQRDRAKVPNVDAPYAARFFQKGEYSTFALPNSQVLDFDGLLGRLLSASYMPPPTEQEKFARLVEDVRSTFDAHCVRGTVTLLYDTTILLGLVRRAS